MKSKKHNYLSILIFFLCLSFITFNDLGVIKLISIYKQKQIIQEEINELILEDAALMHEITLLTNDDDYIMKMAREKFYMAAPGEKIYRVEEEKFISSK